MTRWTRYHSADWVGLVETGWVTVRVEGPLALMATGRGWTS